ncbi:MAG: CPBP family glutamic-type intramembrane protease, partial [Myxococcota bacterium]
MIYVRNGLLVLTAIIGITVVRRESPDRIGLLPAITPALISIPVACLIALSATPIARLPISPDADLLVVGGLLAIRAIGESVFFHGFVTRTLLIEMREPTHALFLSSLLYGFYALTFVEILGTHPLGIIFGILVYGFGSGFPLAVMYWQTRSVFIPMIAEMIIFIAVAWAGMAHIQTYGVG